MPLRLYCKPNVILFLGRANENLARAKIDSKMEMVGGGREISDFHKIFQSSSQGKIFVSQGNALFAFMDAIGLLYSLIRNFILLTKM